MVLQDQTHPFPFRDPSIVYWMRRLGQETLMISEMVHGIRKEAVKTQRMGVADDGNRLPQDQVNPDPWVQMAMDRECYSQKYCVWKHRDFQV